MNICDLPFLTKVKENQINLLVEKKMIFIKKFNQNQTVYNYKTECKGLDIVLNGSLVAYSLSSNGAENIVFNFSKNNIIGGNLLFGDINIYPLDIFCTQTCELLHISKKAVTELLNDNYFMLNFIKSISQNSQGMNKKIAMHTRKSLRDNLLDYFGTLSIEQKSNTIALPFSKKHMADYFGVQRPSLFRELKKLKDEKIISICNKEITLINNINAK